MREKAKKVAIIQARMTSSRLRGKVVLPLSGQPVLVRLIERVKHIQNLDQIVLAIPQGKEHDLLENIPFLKNFKIVRGSETNVLERYLEAIEATKADIVMRITGDCPVLDPQVSSSVLSSFLKTSVAYASTDFKTGFPLGLDTEVFEACTLQWIQDKADAYEQEHVTPYLWRRPDVFPALYLTHVPDYKKLRLTLDTHEDYVFISKIYQALFPQNPLFGFYDIIKWIGSIQPSNLCVKQNPLLYQPSIT